MHKYVNNDRSSMMPAGRVRFLALAMFALLAAGAGAKPAPEGSIASPRPTGKGAAKTSSAVKTGTGRLLVLLVEFSGTDVTTWSAATSQWDPIGKCNPDEFFNAVGDGYHLASANGLETTHPITFSYSGPLHNTIARPLSEADPSGRILWTPDFSPAHYQSLIFGGGVRLNYKRQDNSQVDQNFLCRSLNDFLKSMSNNQYQISGEVVGWLQLPHSVWWYGADQAPGARSTASGYTAVSHGYFPGGGSRTTLIQDALNAAKANRPGLDWKSYDQDQDGTIDNLLVIFAGLPENGNTTLLNRTTYGEGTLSPARSSMPAPYAIANIDGTTISATQYLLFNENCGAGEVAREFCLGLGGFDLMTYNYGSTSPGFWSPLSDPWAGTPLGIAPVALDPYNLDQWGWLNPQVISDPTRIYSVTLGQAGAFPAGAGLKRGVKIALPTGHIPLQVKPEGAHYWWGGRQDTANSMMTLKQPIAIPASGETTLTLRLAYDLEEGWDFLWVQASQDGGATWDTLTNKHTRADHDAGWIGPLNGFPDDMAGAGIGGFTGWNASWPAYETEAFRLTQYAGQSIRLRFWYMTDWGTLRTGAFIDNIGVVNGASTIFFDDGENGGARWSYAEPMIYSDGTEPFSHNFYLQWRNTGPGGGFDSVLGDPLWRFGPVPSGLLAWYNNNHYENNDIFTNILDYPGFGPKGRMLLVDAHPEPYRDPYWVSYGYSNEGGNVSSRMQMRDAAFSRNPGTSFTLSADWVATTSTGHIFPAPGAASRFSDGEGYYPGAEYVSRGPGYIPPSLRWVTRQWDASVVMPSKVFYGVKAPGYTKNQEWRYMATRYPGGRLSAYWLGSGIGLGYDGGTGRPRDAAGQYGWNVQIVAQADTTATLVIWNELAVTSVTAKPDVYAMKAGFPTLTTGAATGVLANDTGPSGWKGAARAELVTPPQHGTFQFRADGGFTYQPTDSIHMTDQFTYRILTDFDQQTSSTQATITRPNSAAGWQGYR